MSAHQRCSAPGCGAPGHRALVAVSAGSYGVFPQHRCRASASDERAPGPLLRLPRLRHARSPACAPGHQSGTHRHVSAHVWFRPARALGPDLLCCHVSALSGQSERQPPRLLYSFSWPRPPQGAHWCPSPRVLGTRALASRVASAGCAGGCSLTLVYARRPFTWTGSGNRSW
jgi:hypothetical protein